jgi:hypothetical protein
LFRVNSGKTTLIFEEVVTGVVFRAVLESLSPPSPQALKSKMLKLMKVLEANLFMTHSSIFLEIILNTT